MRLKLLLAVVALTLASCANCDKDRLQKSEKSTPVENFEFLVVLDGSTAIFEAHQGTIWTSLTYGNQGNEEMDFWLNRQGVAGDESGLVGGGFQIAFHTTAYGAVLKSKTGTYWSELTFDCGSTPCRFLVDQNGVRGVVE